MATFRFEEEQFNRLFPFFVLLNRDLKIVSFGKTIGKLCNLSPEQDFESFFLIKRPAFYANTLNDLLRLQNQLVIIEDRSNGKNIFRGQIEYLQNSECVLFVGSPWFGSMDTVHAQGLTLHDFAIHDPILDLLHVLKTQEMFNDDIKKLLNTVNKQRNELKHLSLFAAQTSSAIIITNHLGEIEWVNNAFGKITGYALGEVQGKKPGSLLQGPDTNIGTILYLREQMAKGEPFQCEILNYTKLGKPYWVKLNGQAMRDKTGKITQYFALHEDITLHKTIELEMDEQRNFYESIINHLPANIAVFSADHRFLFLNPASIRDPHLRKWMIGKYEEDYAEYRGVSKKTAFGRRAMFDEVLQTKQLKSWEEPIEKPGEPSKYFLRHLYPVVDEQDNIKMIIGYGINITELKNVQHELELAKQKTEEMAEARQKFLATMSHEIRTPMNGILGILSLFEKTSLDAPQQEMLRIIQESANNLLAIANDVLDIEKIIAGKIELEALPFNLSEKIHLLTDSFKFKSNEKNIQLNCHNLLPPDMVVKGDPFRLSQVLTNLIENAIKFTEKGSVTVSAKLHHFEANHVKATFLVEDTGIGVSADNLTKIFEPYAQANASISRKYGGTGLGLSICRELVQRMGGNITLHSEEGKGSRFEVMVPFERGSLEQGQVYQSHIALEVVKNLRILVAEDVDINQFLIKHILQSWNCQFNIVDDGTKVVTALEVEDYDLILMDIQMPEMDGLEACKMIRAFQNPKKAAIPIVALTAYALRGDQGTYLEAGMNDCLAKPFTEADLYDMVLRMVSSSRREASSAPQTHATRSIPALYNLSQLTILSKGDHGFVTQMIHLFKQNMPVLQQQLMEALVQENWDLVSAIAHKMKPALDSMGIHSLKEVIRAVEHCAKNPVNKDLITKQVTLIDDTLNTCMEQINAQQPNNIPAGGAGISRR